MRTLTSTFKIATVWLLLGTAVFLAFQVLEKKRHRTQFQASGNVVEIRRGPDGHYHWPGRINGHPVEFLIDTGATGTALPARLSKQLRLEPIGDVRSSTAGGVVTGQLVRADIELDGGVQARSLRVVSLPGLDDRPLLGMDVLARLRWQQDGGVMRFDLRPSPAPSP